MINQQCLGVAILAFCLMDLLTVWFCLLSLAVDGLTMLQCGIWRWTSMRRCCRSVLDLCSKNHLIAFSCTPPEQQDSLESAMLASAFVLSLINHTQPAWTYRCHLCIYGLSMFHPYHPGVWALKFSFIHIRLLVQQLTKRNFAIELK